MRALIQRVSEASITIDGEPGGSIGQGYVILLGVGKDDTPESCEKLWRKVKKLRLFKDEAGKTNLNLETVGGALLIVSQFTLYADVRRGNRPGFTAAAPPALGESLYELFVELARREVSQVETGTFGADMQIALVNDGPFTVWVDTEDL